MLKIAYIAPYYHPAAVYGGPTVSMYNMGRALAHHGCDVRVLTTNANGLGQVLDVDTTRELVLEPGLRIRYCQRLLMHAASPALVGALPGYMRWCDVVHIGSIYNFTAIPALASARAFGKPAVVSPQGALQRWKRSTKPLAKDVWEAVCRAIAPSRLALHVTSKSEEEQSLRRMPKAIGAFIPHGVSVPAELPARTTGDGRLRLLSLGRLNPIKGIENLLTACAEYEKTAGSDWSLTIAGDGERSYTAGLQRLVDGLGLAERVQMVGHVDGEEKARLFAAADLFVAPSFTENFGMAIAEALAHGLPVVAGKGTPWSGLPEHGCGLWVDNDPASLASALRRAREMPLAIMGLAGRSWMLSEFTPERAAASMCAVYEQLVRRG